MNLDQLPNDPQILKQILIKERIEKNALAKYIVALQAQLRQLGVEPAVIGPQPARASASAPAGAPAPSPSPSPSPSPAPAPAPAPSGVPPAAGGATPGKPRVEMKARRGGKKGEKGGAAAAGDAGAAGAAGAAGVAAAGAAAAGAAAAGAAAGAGAGAGPRSEPQVFSYSDTKREMLNDKDKARVLELAAPLLQAIKDNDPTRFYVINLSGKSYSPIAAEIMAAAIKPLRGIQVADFHDIMSGRSREDAVKTLNTLCSAVKGQNLSMIDLSGNALGAQGVAACAPAFEGQQDLEIIKVNNDGLEGKAGELLTQLILANHPDRKTKLVQFEILNNLLKDAGAIALAPLFAASPSLRHLVYSGTRMEPAKGKGDVALTGALRHLRHLEHLDISDNNLSSKVGPDVVEIIKNNPDLIFLSIGNNFLKEAVPSILKAIKEFAPALRYLRLPGLDLTQAHSALLVALVQSKPNLIELSLADNNDLETTGAIPIVKALKDHKSLEILSFGSCGLDAEIVPHIVKNVCKPGLKKLDLNSNRIHAVGVQIIRDARRKTRSEVIEDGNWTENEDDDEPDENVMEMLDKLKIKH